VAWTISGYGLGKIRNRDQPFLRRDPPWPEATNEFGDLGIGPPIPPHIELSVPVSRCRQPRDEPLLAGPIGILGARRCRRD